MVLSNYERKTSHSLGVIQVNIVLGTIAKPTLSVVISTKENYNLLLGQEWIHEAWAIPLTLHQMISIWRPNGISAFRIFPFSNSC